MMALWAVDSGEAILEITAFKLIVDYIRNNRSEKAILFFKSLLVMALKIFVMIVEQVPQRRFLRISRVIYRRMFNPLLRLFHGANSSHIVCQGTFSVG